MGPSLPVPSFVMCSFRLVQRFAQHGGGRLPQSLGLKSPRGQG